MTTFYKLSQQARARTLGDEGVVVLQDDAEVVITNRSGALIIELCRAGATHADIVARLEQEFGISKEQAAADAREFIDNLLACGALVGQGNGE